MRAFDLDGHRFELRLTTLEAIRCRSLGLDLGKFVDDPKSLGPTVNEPAILGPILWAIVEKQAAAFQVSQERFYECLEGDTLEAATRAFIMAAFDFFPNAATRKVLIRGFEAAEKVTAGKMALALEKLEQQPTLSNSATNSVESPESIPQTTA